jgi:hypothetical protein
VTGRGEITLDTPQGQLHLTWPEHGAAKPATATLDGEPVSVDRVREIVCAMWPPAKRLVAEAADAVTGKKQGG